jgi:hypothetical protein
MRCTLTAFGVLPMALGSPVGGMVSKPGLVHDCSRFRCEQPLVDKAMYSRVVKE